MHLEATHGDTIRLILEAGFAVDRRLPFVTGEPAGDAAKALEATGDALGAVRPDALMLVGDRSETLAAGVAAVLRRVPIVHLHGGEETEGAVDNAFRHALTKLSQLHLVSHETHAAVVRQMGEAPDRVVVVGAPGLDNLYRDDLPDRLALEALLGGSLRDPVVVVTVHPTTLGDEVLAETRALAAAMESVEATFVITQPNVDQGAAAIRAFWSAWAERRPRVFLVDALGETSYWGLLRLAQGVAGNSSSGIIEAHAMGIASLNIGDRQRGRLRSAATIDAPANGPAVAAALRRMLEPEARERARRLPPVYPAGPAAPRVVAALRAWLPHRTDRKRFEARR